MRETNQKLWEILVPVFNDKTKCEFTVEYHHKWDNHVRKIAGGLTINKRARGIWTNPDTEKIFQEKVIPVRIFCSMYEIEEIIDYTLEYYKQEAVMCYLISDTVFIKYKDE